MEEPRIVGDGLMRTTCRAALRKERVYQARKARHALDSGINE
jgi:hypothetical protein